MSHIDEIRARVEALERANEPHIPTGAEDRWTGLDDIREDDAIEADFTDHAPADLRWLLDERDRLLAELAERDEALALLRRTPNPYDYGDSRLRWRCNGHYAEVAAFIARVDGEGGDRG